MITLEDINIVIEEIKKNNSREFINIIIEENDSLNLTDSKFGGLPYIPLDSDIPIDSNGNQLALLAQINCADLPENTLYPKEGLLQFWISRNDNFGLGNKKDYCVKYIENIENSITIENILTKYNLLNEENSEEYSPFNKKNTSFALKFEKGISTITSNDFLFEDIALKTICKLLPDENIEDLYNELEREFLMLYSKLLMV